MACARLGRHIAHVGSCHGWVLKLSQCPFEIGEWTPPESRKFLYSGDGLVLQNTYHDATILCLSFRRLVVADLVALSHCTRCQHSGEGNVALLKQDSCDGIRAGLIVLLVQGAPAAGVRA